MKNSVTINDAIAKEIIWTVSNVPCLYNHCSVFTVV